MLNMYTESADHDPTNSLGLASENLHAVIWTLRRGVGGFPCGENRRTHLVISINVTGGAVLGL